MIALALAAALVLSAGPAAGAPSATPVSAQPAAPKPATQERPAVCASAPAQGPDVELHVPRADVAKLGLEVENLVTRLDVDTGVASLVRISAGVVATVQKLKVEMEGVQAETHLVVRLDRVTQVLETALASIDQHPELAPPPTAGAPAPAPQVVPAISTTPSTPVEPRHQPGRSDP